VSFDDQLRRHIAAQSTTAPSAHPNRKNTAMLTGIVIWFDATKSFGFLKRDDGGPDVYVHSSAFANAGTNPASVAPGQRYTCGLTVLTTGACARISLKNFAWFHQERSSVVVMLGSQKRCCRCYSFLRTLTKLSRSTRTASTAMGQTRSFGDVRVMSAFPPIATERRTWRHFAFGP
jgi:cold shock protein